MITEHKTPREAFEAHQPYREDLLLTEEKGVIAIASHHLPIDKTEPTSTPVNVMVAYYFKAGSPSCVVRPGIFFTN